MGQQENRVQVAIDCGFKFAHDPDPDKRVELENHLYKEFTARLAQLIASAITPFSLGISGEWGRGKTFVMSKVFLDPAIASRFKIARFDAWRVPPGQALLPFLVKDLGKQFNIKESEYAELYNSSIILSSATAAVIPGGIGYKILYHAAVGLLNYALSLKKKWSFRL